ncbi:MAG: S1/P1 Nuclease [Candidatus Eremiobacteraeota bacterium]|nr:S1/P1 Nuclease [Candidatus Eremiobacteraeota bacterium]MBC5827886.1 S1/P1 Nuclease [Candidatus Eremiobacteraeota bacterium]
MRIVAFSVCCLTVFLSSPGLAWGIKGHTIIGQAAVAHLPADLPAFVRTPAAKDEIVYLQAEEDRLKIGEADERAWYAQWPPDHYVDVGDDETIGGIVRLDALPATREAFILALSRAGKNPYKFGFVPYAVLEGYEQVRSDFALWRLAVADARLRSGSFRSAARTEVGRREALTIHDIGIFSHFVGDASQPLHVSVHYNGWGKYPNPNGFSQARNTHAEFEDDFVAEYLDAAAVTPLVGASSNLARVPLAQIQAYIASSAAQVGPFYELKKRGAFSLHDRASSVHREGVRFTATRLAAGAAMLDSLIETAWRTSAGMKFFD